MWECLLPRNEMDRDEGFEPPTLPIANHRDAQNQLSL
jgi:hypothetical protein